MSMITNAFITGGVFSQNFDQRQTQMSAMGRLQEAVAPSAFHNSGERFDPPKCHPNTRVAVRDKIEKWASHMDPDTRDASILWLSGAAGAGKSAIAQTVAEDFHSKGLLAASFFFGRSDSTRNHARSLVATILYQLYPFLPAPHKSHLLAVIDCDPLIFTKSLAAQFEALVVDPLLSLFYNGFWTRRLIIIDGLDECLDRDMQRNVLLMLTASVRRFHLPFIFLLASRPEHDIQAVFSSPDFLPIHTRLFLDDTYLPDNDIELFLREQFVECQTSHPFRQMIPVCWPSHDIVKRLTRKSSGQFIYASVVAKYVRSPRHQPHHRLDVVLNLRPASRDLPFAELDALYAHIFSTVTDIERALDIINFKIMFRDIMFFNDDIERILRLDGGEVAVLLCDLAAVIDCGSGQYATMKILHASLVDYLLDRERSKEYFVNTSKRRADHVINCLQFLSSVQFDSPDPLGDTARTASLCFKLANYSSVDLTAPLYNAIKGFSISRIYTSMLKDAESWYRKADMFLEFTYNFLPAFFKFLRRLGSAELYQHHQSGYDFFLRESMKACRPNAALAFAPVTIYRKLPKGAFLTHFHLFYFGDRPIVALLALHPSKDINSGFMEYLSDYLRDPKRSRECYAGPKIFAQAVQYCLLYLCNHTAPAQKAPPRLSARQRIRRKNTPWRWHRRVIREDIRGPRDTPWLWLRHVDRHGDMSRTCVLHRQTNDLIYIHNRNMTVSLLSSKDNDPVMYRIRSEKYHLALTYLNYFLPRAAKLDDLVHMCQNLTFASLSQKFPRLSARARSNMQKYVAQWG